MPNVERYASTTSSLALPTTGSALSRREQLRARRELTQLESQTLQRMAAVQAEGMVQADKCREIDHLGRVAMTGQAMLVKRADTVASGDQLLRDELKFFTDVCRMGKGEVIADTIDSYCRESRR